MPVSGAMSKFYSSILFNFEKLRLACIVQRESATYASNNTSFGPWHGAGERHHHRLVHPIIAYATRASSQSNPGLSATAAANPARTLPMPDLQSHCASTDGGVSLRGTNRRSHGRLSSPRDQAGDQDAGFLRPTRFFGELRIGLLIVARFDEASGTITTQSMMCRS